MSLRGLAVLVALLAVAAAALVWLGRPAPDGEGDAASAPLLELRTDAVRGVEIASSTETIVLARDDVGWTLRAPLVAEADARQVDALLEGVREARVARVVETDAADLARYGLDPPERRITLETTEGIGPIRLLLGRSSPVAWQRYVSRRPGDVVLVDGSLGTALERTGESFREMRLIPVEPSRMRRVEIVGPATRVVLEKEGSAWWLREPFSDRADLDVAERITHALGSIRFESVASPPPPALGPAQRIAAWADAGAIEAEVALAASGGRRLARRARDGVVGDVAETSAVDLEGDAEAIREKRLATFSLSEVRAVAWTADGSSWSLARETEGGAWTRREGAGEVPKEGAVDAVLEAVRRLRLDEAVARGPLRDRSARVVIGGAGGPLVEVELGPMASGGTWARSSWRPGIVGRLDDSDATALLEASRALAR